MSSFITNKAISLTTHHDCTFYNLLHASTISNTLYSKSGSFKIMHSNSFPTKKLNMYANLKQDLPYQAAIERVETTSVSLPKVTSQHQQLYHSPPSTSINTTEYKLISINQTNNQNKQDMYHEWHDYQQINAYINQCHYKDKAIELHF